jgi:thiamine-phosphate pyrophosphorylase
LADHNYYPLFSFTGYLTDSYERGMNIPPCQLYLISPQHVSGDFPKQLEEALSAGPVAAFQFRVKGVDNHEAARLAAPLQKICAEHDVAFIVNDNVTLAKRLKADGVHLGQSDGDVKEAREELGPDVQIGVTCHNSRHLAMEAGEAGADYVAFGAFYPTDTKEVAHIAEIETLQKWALVMEVPCVAIGGITPENAPPLIAAGAEFIAVCGAVWRHPDGPAAAVKAFNAVLA